ncbi:hypothetical protein BHM03_00020921 [Ensete ventricosum]|uniref:Uncharacterized protein n=1 Tax=Ensete ventricosum TaxID=4639 RepID=A0A426YBW5_ENSVE|nr:hypothetical protein B296_00026399 [Ensete ventricosum]RZR73149.1 hypothetical protein BHM03_00020921 [Ensete ventricosum]
MVRLPYLTALTTLFSYGLLFAFGQLRDFFRKIIDWSKSSSEDLKVPPLLLLIRSLSLLIPLLVSLFSVGSFKGILLLSRGAGDCFSRPIASAPDAWIDVVERYSNDNNKTLQ